MKRRDFIQNVRSGLYAAAGTLVVTSFQASQAKTTTSAGGLTVQWLGHSCFLFSGGGQRILVNPFKPGGCTAKYPAIKIEPNLVLISSQLLDEGFVDTLPGDPKLLFESGIYRVGAFQIQGIPTDHDRNGGRRFGQNMAWKWTQSGLKILHLGGTAAPISLEQQILMGQPDLLFVPIGGGPKTFTPQEAVQAVQTLKPKIVIPTQFQTAAADPTTCSLASEADFIKLMGETPTQRIAGSTLTLGSRDVPSKGSVVYLLSNPV